MAKSIGILIEGVKMKAFTVIRVSGQDQLQRYGPDVQWQEVLTYATSLGLEPTIEYRRIIQESATDWDRDIFESTVREGLKLYHNGEVQAMIFPRVDRETRFVFGSFPLLSEVIKSGMPVYFARDQFRLDPMNAESVERYFNKALQAQAYVTTMKENVMRGVRIRAERDHRMPTGGPKWAYNYHHYRSYQRANNNSGRYTINNERATWVKQWKDWILYEGLSLQKVGQRFKELSGIKLQRSTILRILSDPIVTGKVYAYRHKRIVDSRGRKYRISVPENDWLLVYEDPTLTLFSDEEYRALKRKFEITNKILQEIPSTTIRLLRGQSTAYNVSKKCTL